MNHAVSVGWETVRAANDAEPWQTDKSYLKRHIRLNLDKAPSPSKATPRYGVTFEDHVIPEERALWLAQLHSSSLIVKNTANSRSFEFAANQDGRLAA